MCVCVCVCPRVHACVCVHMSQWAEYRDMRHDLFVPQGGEVLLLESGASAETLLLEN